jgi:hypothetical protein
MPDYEDENRNITEKFSRDRGVKAAIVVIRWLFEKYKYYPSIQGFLIAFNIVF